MSIVEQLRAACVLVQSPASHGTAYLVAPTKLVTCHHVVESAGEGGTVELLLRERKVEARVAKLDQSTDCAILELAEPLPGHSPLPLARRSEQRAQWDGYGFPGLGQGAGVPFFGVVLDPESDDDLKRPMLTLYSEMVAAGLAAPINGMSGGPVMVDGAVVGHFSRVLGTPGEPGKPALGVVYASRASNVLALLGTEPAVDVARMELPPGLAGQVPALGPDEYHAFLSYRSTDHAFARRLYERLDAVGFKVFLDQRELVVGDQLAVKLHAALGRSRCGIVLVSRGWVESAWCREEGNRIAHRAVEEEGRFRAIPVKLDDVEMPDIFDARLWVDFVGASAPSGRKLDQIIYALLGKAVPAETSVAAKVQTTLTDATDELLRRADDLLRDPTRSREVLRFVQQSGLPEVALKLRCAQALIDAGSPQRALEILSSDMRSQRAQQLRALARSRAGDHTEARAILEPMFARGELDAETGGILGGIYKRVWRETNNRLFLIKSAETYAATHAIIPSDTYVAINVAAMSLLLDNEKAARSAAKRVLDTLGSEAEAKLDEWKLATLAEAFLILGDLERAAEWCRKAVARAFTRPASIAALRRQVRLLLPKLGKDAKALDSSLPVPAVVAFSGHLTDAPGQAIPRFPEGKQSTVRRAIQKWLRDRGAGVHAVSSAARGADLLFLEEVLANGGTATVLLPFPRADFKKVSVGQGWDARFDKVLDDARVDDRPPLAPTLAAEAEQPAAFERCNDAIIEEAEKLARAFDDDDPVLLTVWNGSPGDGAGSTSSMVAAWTQLGDRHENIDLSKL